MSKKRPNQIYRYFALCCDFLYYIVLHFCDVGAVAAIDKCKTNAAVAETAGNKRWKDPIRETANSKQTSPLLHNISSAHKLLKFCLASFMLMYKLNASFQ